MPSVRETDLEGDGVASPNSGDTGAYSEGRGDPLKGGSGAGKGSNQASAREGVSFEGVGEDESPVGSGPADVSQLNETIVALQQEAERKHDRLVRTVADFDNFRKRSRRELTTAIQQAEEKVALRFLPIIDNLERAISHGEEGLVRDGAGDVPGGVMMGLLDGVKMVHRQFIAALGEFEIEGFDSVGQNFDPEVHEAIQQVDSPAAKHTVLVEVQRGYRRAGRLVRPAMVVVSRGQGEGSNTGPETTSPAEANRRERDGEAGPQNSTSPGDGSAARDVVRPGVEE